MTSALKTGFGLAAGFTLLAGLSLPVLAQTHPDLSGVWEVRFDSKNVPPAALTVAAANLDKNAQYEHDLNAARWCHFFGMPFVMDVSPIDIVQNTNGKEVLITFSVRNPSRHVYTDGRGHVSAETFDPTSDGNSIGRWDGDALVVDTVGFSDEGMTAIPGGGHRTPDSHLVERFRLINNGTQLSVVSTWEDSKVFAKPHTYEYRYYRAPKGTELREYDCNASDENRAKYLTPAGKPASK
jgi:hypothetical protein